MTVKTYVVFPVPEARRRVHVTWYASEVRPEMNAITKASRTREVGGPSVAVSVGAVLGATEGASATVAASDAARGSRASQSADSPAISENAAPTRSAPDSPSSSMRMRPAASVPRIAPDGVRGVQPPEREAQL